jgi:hypothetical protein
MSSGLRSSYQFAVVEAGSGLSFETFATLGELAEDQVARLTWDELLSLRRAIRNNVRRRQRESEKEGR